MTGIRFWPSLGDNENLLVNSIKKPSGRGHYFLREMNDLVNFSLRDCGLF